jgi:hypothetical protein
MITYCFILSQTVFQDAEPTTKLDTTEDEGSYETGIFVTVKLAIEKLHGAD